MTDKEKRLLELLDAVAETDAEEIDCDAFLDRVAGYVERLGPEEALSDEFRAVAKHIRICPECREEFEALLALYRGT